MRHLRVGMVVSVQLVVSLSMFQSHAGPFSKSTSNSVKLEPRQCSELINTFLAAEYGASDENALPSTVEKTKYAPKELQASFEIANQHLSKKRDEEAKEDLAGIQKYKTGLQRITELYTAKKYAEERLHSVQNRLAQLQDVEGGTGLSEAKQAVQILLKSAEKSYQDDNAEHLRFLQMFENTLKKDGFELVQKYNGEFTLKRPAAAEKAMKALNDPYTNPASAASEDLRKILMYDRMNRGLDKATYDSILGKDAEFLVIQPSESGFKDKIKKEKAKRADKIKLVRELDVLETEAKNFPELKNLQADYLSKKAQVEKLEPEELDSVTRTYRQMRNRPGARILRVNGVVKSANLSGQLISCDENGAVRHSYDLYKNNVRVTEIHDQCQKMWSERQSLCQPLFKEVGVKATLKQEEKPKAHAKPAIR